MRAQRIVWLPLATLWCLLGAWCGLVEAASSARTSLASLSDGLLRTVEGTVVDAGVLRGEAEQNLNDNMPDDPAQAPQPTQRIDVRVSSLEMVTDIEDNQAYCWRSAAHGALAGRYGHPSRSSDKQPASQKIQPFRCGDRIRADVRLLPPEVYHDPGVWSREDYLLDQGITSTASVANRARRARRPIQQHEHIPGLPH